ncbi:UDP-glucose 6-dehydrogenase [Penicillium argentinense]|uniref:UDP-glucose 6-dehydrogenase n=1 Tax=Penicillium argentinense TaxID=1131581 RepID=A0A9W9K7H6_9EURO|nr:UDP-glucose 6-dehydrogenase [Penicillium argentinense]KAJ5095012.1 UDP-glucose 6-dehydrogenase [Penicillium argentinense]
MTSTHSTGDSEPNQDHSVINVSTVPTTPTRSRSCSPSLDASTDPDSVLSNSKLEDSDNESIRPKPVRNVCFVGAGYVGGPTAAVIAHQNPSINVTVVDKDQRRIRRWNSRHLPIYEPGLADIVRVARDGLLPFGKEDEQLSARKPNLFFSSDVSKSIAESDIVLIAVNTPTKTRGAGSGRATDMTSFEAVAAEVVRHAKPGTIIVEKSTVPCRTAEMIQEMIRIQRPGTHFEILSNPEFLAAGTAVQDLLNPDRIIIGSAPTPEGRTAGETLAGVYASWIDRSRILTTNVWSSELAKLVANSMLAQRLSSINSISAICEATGAEVKEVSAAIGRDARLGDKFLRAGIGFGGSCFAKDINSLAYIAESLGLHEVAEYWRQVLKINNYQRDRFAARVIQRLRNTLVTKKVTVLGYAFKKNTSDTREAPALEIIKTLLDENPREIAVYDPCCNPYVIENEIRSLQNHGSPALNEDGGPVMVYSDAYEACAGANAIIIVTDFDEFRNEPIAAVVKGSAETQTSEIQNRFNVEPECAADCPDCHTTYGESTDHTYTAKEQLDWSRISTDMTSPKWLFDGRCIIDASKMSKLGIRVESIGSAGLGV